MLVSSNPQFFHLSAIREGRKEEEKGRKRSEGEGM